MMNAKKPDKIVYITDLPCPHCGQIIVVKKKVKTLAPAQKAEKEEKYFAEKGQQLTLDQSKAPIVTKTNPPKPQDDSTTAAATTLQQ